MSLKSFCEISATPQFQFTVTELTPELGDKANKEAYRDYMEYGKLRDASDILDKLNKAYFSPIRVVAQEIQSDQSNEIAMTKKDMFKDLGMSVPKKQISNQQVINLRKAISLANNNLAKKGVDRVYRLMPPVQVGQSDNFTWEVKAFKGKLDVAAKAQRLSNNDREKNTLPGMINQGTQTTLNFKETQAAYSQEFIRKYADVLNLQMGVDYEFITPARAEEITRNTDNPWKDQKSFFLNGKIYFLEGTLTPDDVLHEFIHPVIRAMAKQNRPLFNALYAKLQTTSEGAKIIEEVTKLYPNLTQNADDFKEEVLVRSLAKMQDVNSKGLESSPTFQKFLSDLLFNIKQFLRKFFGQKIKVENIDPSTTLGELSQILRDGKAFELDIDVISDKDFVAYKTEFTENMKEFVAENADTKEMITMVNNYFEATKKQLRALEKRGDLDALADVMANRYKTGELQRTAQGLKPYQTLILQDAKEFADEIEANRERALAVIGALGNTENLVKKLHEGLKEIVKDIDDPENVGRVLYYQKVINYWQEFVNNVSRNLENNGISNLKIVDNINATTRRANDLIEDFYAKASKEVLWSKLKTTAENIDRKWAERIKDLKSRNAPAAEIERAEREAKDEKITPEMIEAALKGNLKDLSFAGMYMEGYSFSPDPVVGGLARYIKDAITKTEVKAQAAFNEASRELKPLTDKVGYDPNNPGKIGEDLGQKEKVGRVNHETGEFEEVEKWVFKNQFTGADLVRDQYLFKIKKASEKYQETGTEEDKLALANLQAEWEQHRQDYFHAEYSNEFHNAYAILRKDDLGNTVRMEMNLLYDQINELSAHLVVANAQEVLDIADQIEAVRRQIKQMSSLYDVAGDLKTGEDLEKAMRLQQFNEAIRDIYESEEVPGAFQNAYSAYEQKLIDEGKKPGTPLFEEAMEAWLKRNTRVSITDEFWEKMDLINTAIKDIISTIPQQEVIAQEIDEAYKVIKDLVKGNRDEGGQPIGTEMSPEKQQKIKEAQEKIELAREKLNRLSGLSKAENDQIQAIFARMGTPGTKITTKEQLTLSRLLDKQAALRLSKIQRAELNSLFAELDELRTKEPTDAYLEAANSFLSDLGEDGFAVFDNSEISKESAFKLGVDEIVQSLMETSEDFKEWFLRNHTSKVTMDWKTMTPKTVWNRTYAWNVIKPNDAKYYASTEVTKVDGTKEVLPVLPSLKFFKRVVKEEYKTKKIVGETVDNRGYWLPKTMAQGAKDDRYINKDYERLRQNNPDLFNLLEAVKRIHLKTQEGLNGKAKLWLDMPRFRKQTVERLLSDNPVMRIIQRFKDFFVKVKDGWDQGLNYEDNMQLVKLDLFDDDTTGIPMAGLSNLPIEEISTDAIYTLFRYMQAAERNKQLTEIAPVARMIQKTVNNPKNFPLEQRLMGTNTLVQTGRKNTKYARAQAVNNYLERVFEGRVNAGWGSDNAIAVNTSNFIFQRAAKAYLDLNIPSAIKNAVGMKFQGMIEAIAGRYMSPQSFIAGENWATNTAMTISMEIYKQGPKSLNVQLTEIFDPERDRFYHHYGESMTRTPGKDYSFLILQRMTDFRRWTQLQASLQTFAGMMKHQKVPTTNGGHISYLDAWEVRDGKIQLKEGVDPEWGITYDQDGNQKIGEKYVQKRNEIHRVIDHLNGAMSREDSPEANRYLLFRYISFFRRFLIGMLTNRLAYSGSLLKGNSRGRFDYQLGDTKEGFYITTMKVFGRTMMNLGRNLPYMKPEEKAAAMRTVSEVGIILILKYLVLPLMFGWNPDDEDRFKKLRAKSDALPAPGVHDDPDREFDFGGWMENHAQLQVMQVTGENSMFIPWPGFGLDDYREMIDLKSMAIGPTLGTMYDLTKDFTYIVTGDDRAYYKRSIGPYEFQQEGNLKIWAHIARSFGMTGSHVDPVKGIKGYQTIENR